MAVQKKFASLCSDEFSDLNNRQMKCEKNKVKQRHTNMHIHEEFFSPLVLCKAQYLYKPLWKPQLWRNLCDFWSYIEMKINGFFGFSLNRWSFMLLENFLMHQCDDTVESTDLVHKLSQRLHCFVFSNARHQHIFFLTTFFGFDFDICYPKYHNQVRLYWKSKVFCKGSCKEMGFIGEVRRSWVIALTTL